MISTVFGPKHAQTSPTGEFGDGLVDSLFPSFVRDILVTVQSSVSTETFLIILMVFLIMVIMYGKQTMKYVSTRLNKEQFRSEFSTVFERVWRWLPFTKSTLEEYSEIACSFEDLEEEFQEEHR